MSCLKLRRMALATLVCMSSLLLVDGVTAQEAPDRLTSKLTPFLAQDAAIFFLTRPSQFFSSAVAQRMEAKIPESLAVEFAAAGVSASAMKKSIPAQSTAQSEASQPSFAILVRFVNDVSAEQILEFVRNARNPKTSKLNYRIQPWNGTEILRCDDKDAPAAWLIDSKTLIVADLKSFVSGLQQKDDNAVSANIWKRMAGNGQCDISVALDMQKMVAFSQSQSMRVPPSAQQTKFVNLGVNLSQGDLFRADAEMANENAAKELADGFKMLLMMGTMQVSSALEPEMVELVTPIISSIQITSDATDVAIRVPRPENFEQLVDRFANAAKEGKLPISHKELPGMSAN